MPGPLATLGMQAAGQAIGSGMGLMLGGIERKKQRQQAEYLQEIQMKGQREMTDYNYGKQLQLWKDTGYGPQMDQLKEAGLNPGLIYGMGGAGGQSSNIQQGNVSGQAARQGGEAAAMGISMGQAALMAAQIENIKAQTEKTKAETTNVPLTGQNIQAQTGSLLQGIEESKTKQALIETETAIGNIRQAVAGATQNAEIAKILYGLEILNNDRTISNETRDAKINQIKAESIGAGLENILTTAKTANMRQDTQLKWQQVEETIGRIKAMIANVAQGWDQLEIQRESNKLREQANDLNDPSLTPQINNIVSGVVGGILGGAGAKSHIPVGGFHKR